jgi:hypothetical protein
MTSSPKQPFDQMTGLPTRDDKELEPLMEAAARLPSAAAEEVIRSLLRAAVGYERTGDVRYLTCLAQDALVTFRLRRDPETGKALDAAPASPGDPADAADVEEVLARHGL